LIRVSVVLLSLACAASSTVRSGIDGQYDGPGGVTLKLARTRYEFCNKGCSSGLIEVRPSGMSTGRVTFYGVPVTAYFRSAQRGASSAGLRTWGEGVETGYRLGRLGVSIDIDREHGLLFKRRR
jgi:hypothetical protein